MQRLSLALLCMCLFFGCNRQVAKPSSVHLQVNRKATNGRDLQETIVNFHPPAKAEIIVESGGQRSMVVFDAKNPNCDKESNVTLVAKRQKVDAEVQIETLIQPQTPNGASAGGPSIFKFDAERPLSEVLDVTISDGEFPLNEPIVLGTMNNNSITLTVRELSN